MRLDEARMWRERDRVRRERQVLLADPSWLPLRQVVGVHHKPCWLPAPLLAAVRGFGR